MVHKIKYIAKNRSGYPLVPQGITLHETATPGATAENSFQYFNREYVGASAHVFVDWNERIQMVPYNESAWHAGTTANCRYIGVEMCHPEGHNPEQFRKVWDGTVELFAELIKQFNLSVDDINTHHEISLKWGETDHVDPTSFLAEYGEDINSFKKAVENKLNGDDLTMAQYEELVKIIKHQEQVISDLNAKVDSLINHTSTYKYLNKGLNAIAPDAFKALQTAVDKGVIGYGEDGFIPGLTKDMIRIVIYMYRMGLFN